MFKETCYDDEMKKFRLICIDNCLKADIASLGFTKLSNNSGDSPRGTTAKSTNIQDTSGLEQNESRRLSSVRGCMDFICRIAGGGQNLLRRIEQLAHDFEQRHIVTKSMGQMNRYTLFTHQGHCINQMLLI